MISYEAMAGAMAGYGFVYSIMNGYGVLHGVGMVVLNLLLAGVIVAVLRLSKWTVGQAGSHL
jgi:hypothetical protein